MFENVQKEVYAFMIAFTDIHSHVLHGVDDGSKDILTAVTTLKKMSKLGVKNLILTPHYCKRRGYETSVESIKRAYKELCDICSTENIGIHLYLGTEMEYSTDTVRYIREGRVLTLADTKYILTEFAPYVSSNTVLKACNELLQLGYTPIIAHVERYEALCNHFELLHELKDRGVLIQVNIRSVCSAGFKLRRFLKRIFSEGIADFLAGDVHNYPIDRKEMEKCKKFVVKNSSDKYYRKLLHENADNIINGGQI